MIWFEDLPGRDDVSCKARSSWKLEVLWQKYAVALMCRWVPCRRCVLGYFHWLVVAAVCLHVFYTVKVAWLGPVNTTNGLVVRFRDGNHSILASNPNSTQRSFAQKVTFWRYHYNVLLRSHYYVLLPFQYYILLSHYTLINPSLLHRYSTIITSLLQIHH